LKRYAYILIAIANCLMFLERHCKCRSTWVVILNLTATRLHLVQTAIAATVLLLYNLSISAQELPDSTTIKHETIDLTDSIAEPQTLDPEIQNTNGATLNEVKVKPRTRTAKPSTKLNPKPKTPTDVILLSDSTDLVNHFPIATQEMYPKHSPAKAAMMSAVLPGLGQIYNRKYWKVPIVYAAVGVSSYIFLKWQNEYTQFRRAYIDLMDNDPYTNYFETLPFRPGTSKEQMLQAVNRRKNDLRTWRDYSIVAVVLSYALNIIDANVDAHLMDFSLDDNISLNIRPCFLENSINSKKIGLTLCLSF